MKLALCSNIGKRRTTNQDYADYFLNDFICLKSYFFGEIQKYSYLYFIGSHLGICDIHRLWKFCGALLHHDYGLLYYDFFAEKT